MNRYVSLFALEALPVPEIIADPPLPPCYLLISSPGIEGHQRLAPDPFLARARSVEVPPIGALR